MTPLPRRYLTMLISITPEVCIAYRQSCRPRLKVVLLASCGQFSFYRQVVTGVIEFVVTCKSLHLSLEIHSLSYSSANLFLRVFALYGRDLRILAFMSIVFGVCIGICIV